jgi:hypothetical protein
MIHPKAIAKQETLTVPEMEKARRVLYRRALNLMIALDLAVAGRCRHVRRMVVMMMAMGQLGHDKANLA